MFASLYTRKKITLVNYHDGYKKHKYKKTKKESKNNDNNLILDKKRIIRKAIKSEKSGMFRIASSIWLKYFDIEDSEKIRSKVSLRREMCIEKTLRIDAALQERAWLNPSKYNLALTETNYIDDGYERNGCEYLTLFIQEHF